MVDSVIDAHIHLWDLKNPWYPGLKAMADDLGRPDIYAAFGIDDYRRTAGDLPVDRFVHVSAVTAPLAFVDELRWVTGLADADSCDMRFVGTVDPTRSAAQIIADLDAQRAITDRLAGVRVLYDFPSDSEAAHTVLQWLTDQRLVFDLVTEPASMAGWLDMLRGYPDLPVVLEHTGWPSGVDPDARAAWQTAIERCAHETSARCKVSGLGMTTLDLSVDALRPWVEPAIETFGWDRVIFGSNIPIEHMAGTFAQLQDSLQSILGEASDEERLRFYAVNAAATYGFGG